MELFTRETIGNYTSDPYANNDQKYSKEMQEREIFLEIDGAPLKIINWRKIMDTFHQKNINYSIKLLLTPTVSFGPFKYQKHYGFMDEKKHHRLS